MAAIVQGQGRVDQGDGQSPGGETCVSDHGWRRSSEISRGLLESRERRAAVNEWNADKRAGDFAQVHLAPALHSSPH